MYEKKEKSCGFIAIIFYLIYLFGLLICGMLSQKNISYDWLYVLLFALGVIIVLAKDRNFKNLGFTNVNRKDVVVTIAIVLVTFFVILIFSKLGFKKVFLQTLYYLFYIGAVEEILFRGFIQNYLFGLNINKYLVFIIGGLLFSFMHLPFQMYVHNHISFAYIIEAIPQLIETFIFHMIMCFIAYKRNNISIPIAIHYTYNILGLLL